jgi:hypothetical protein
MYRFDAGNHPKRGVFGLLIGLNQAGYKKQKG